MVPSLGTVKRIPFNRVSLVGGEIENVLHAIQNGHISGDGHFTHACNEQLEKLVGSCKALLTTSCTHALELAALLLDIRPGDEVIVPSFTFVSTANAFVLRGARPVFVDIRSNTLNLDERLIETKITNKTKAIVPVHYAGVGCEMDEICRIARRHDLSVVEDNAHGLFGTYNDRPLGSFGAFSTLSFHETKNMTCGEGGALLINDAAFVDRAEILREKGTNRSQFFRGRTDKYSWMEVGSSFLPSEILAAFLFAQLSEQGKIQERRRIVWERYERELTTWAKSNGVRLPTVPAHCKHPYHLFYMIFPSLEERQAFIRRMEKNGVMTPFHYVPLHASPVGKKLGYLYGDFPITETTSERLVRLPLYASLSEADQAHVITTITKG